MKNNTGVKVEEADSATSYAIGMRDIHRAIAELNRDDGPDLDHVRMYLGSALIWLRGVNA